VTGLNAGLGRMLTNAIPDIANLESIHWKPTRPQTGMPCTRAIIFWDGRPELSIMRSLAILKKWHVPFTILDFEGNELDLHTFCARLGRNGTNGGNGTKMSTTTTAPLKPSVIVDNAAPDPGQLERKDSKVRIQMHVPEATITQYELQARAAGISLEKVCSDRLRQCVTYTSGRGLYFNDVERAELEKICGGHFINNSAEAMARIRTVVTLKVGDVEIALTGQLLSRCTSRAKAERRLLEEYVKKEVIQGLERAVGLRPY